MKTYKGVEIPTTAAEWELFVGEPGVEGAALKLTAAVERAIDSVEPNIGVDHPLLPALMKAQEEIVGPVQDELAEFGAADSEPEYNIKAVLRQYAGAVIGDEE